jgi:hypothetical protein
MNVELFAAGLIWGGTHLILARWSPEPRLFRFLAINIALGFTILGASLYADAVTIPSSLRHHAIGVTLAVAIALISTAGLIVYSRRPHRPNDLSPRAAWLAWGAGITLAVGVCLVFFGHFSGFSVLSAAGALASVAAFPTLRALYR